MGETAIPDRTVARRRFTVDEYHRMGEAGVLHEDDRVELINGEVVDLTPIGAKHASVVARLTAALVRLVGAAAVVYPQNPLRLSASSEPQPDIVVLKPRADAYAHALPAPSDALLVIEVSDSSAKYDRQVKVPLYAKAGIAEMWIVDLSDDIIDVYREPAGGVYMEQVAARRGDSIVIPSLSGERSVRVDEVV